MSNRDPASIQGIATKLPIGTNSRGSSAHTPIRRKRNWRNCGTTGLVTGRLAERSSASTSREKKTYGYQERDDQKRAEFLAQLATVDPEAIVYADEAGMDNRDQYDYGYSPQGERLFALKSGRRSGRVNMIAALCHQQLLAPFTVEGACNRTIFELWLETCLIPLLRPGQKLVIDNATFHKGGRIEELVKAAGCEVWYLPPYSPDFNKIEHCWSWIKSRIRKCLDEFDTLREAMEHVLKVAS